MNKVDVEFMASEIFTVVNKFVHGHMAKMRTYVDETVERAIISAQPQESFSDMRRYIDSAIDRAITVAKAHADARIDEVRPDEDAETEKSIKRQLSRHADHLAGVESRLKKLERGPN